MDLGVLERTDRVWVSDCIDPLERQQMHRWTTQLIPPELMGAHIASGRSHTTGRVHDLGLPRRRPRSSATSGSSGTSRGPARTSSTSWASGSRFFKQHRGLLLAGDLVRLDFPDPTWSGYGVVAPDAREAIFALVSLARSDVSSPGRMRIPGLDPRRRYHVVPVLHGAGPRGLQMPAWWGLRPGQQDEYSGLHQHPPHLRVGDGGPRGVTLSGAVLASAGLMAPIIDPEQTLIYHLSAADG